MDKISWCIMADVFKRVGVYETTKAILPGEWIVLDGVVYKVSYVDTKDYEVYVYPASEGEVVHLVEEEE